MGPSAFQSVQSTPCRLFYAILKEQENVANRIDTVNPILKTEKLRLYERTDFLGPTFDTEAADSLVFSCYHNTCSAYF